MFFCSFKFLCQRVGIATWTIHVCNVFVNSYIFGDQAYPCLQTLGTQPDSVGAHNVQLSPVTKLIIF